MAVRHFILSLLVVLVACGSVANVVGEPADDGSANGASVDAQADEVQDALRLVAPDGRVSVLVTTVDMDSLGIVDTVEADTKSSLRRKMSTIPVAVMDIDQEGFDLLRANANVVGIELDLELQEEAIGAQPDANALPGVDVQGSQPNIVLINLDDADVDLLDPWAIEAYFPNIRKLIQDPGVRFSNLHAVDPLCGPSRASLFRGQYPHNTEVLENANGWGVFYDNGYTDSEIGFWMKEAGYRTALVGKYCHNNYPAAARDNGYVPPGWDTFHASLGGSYFNFYRNLDGDRVRTRAFPEEYRTDLEAESAVAVLDEHQSDSPLFLYIAPFAPHNAPRSADGMVATRHMGEFATTQVPRTADFNEADVSDKTQQFAALPPLSPQVESNLDTRYQERIQSMLAVDEMIGSVFAALDRNGMRNDTYVFLTSDNGFQLGHHRDAGKHDAFDRVTRVQLLAVGPGIEAESETQDHLLAHIDLVPTILELGGADAPDFLDGKSFVDILDRPSAVDARDWQESILIEHIEDKSVFGVRLDLDYQALRLFDEVYVEWANGEREYYDLAADPLQLTNSYDDLPRSVRQRFQSELARLASCAGANCQLPGASLDPIDTQMHFRNDMQLAGAEVRVDGDATDDVGIAAVHMVIRAVDSRHYWDGERFIDEYATFEASVVTSGTSGTWSTSVELPPGEYWVSARAEDPQGNLDPKIPTRFFTVVDRPAPDSTLTIQPDRLSGFASDPERVSAVQVAVRHVASGQWWDGSTYSEERQVIDATLDRQGRSSTAWSVQLAGLAEGEHVVTSRTLGPDSFFQEPPTTQTFVVPSNGTAGSICEAVLDSGARTTDLDGWLRARCSPR